LRRTLVASAGLPTKPVKNRNARIGEKFFASIIGTLKRRNNARPPILTGFRPIDGISCKGARNIGPMPYGYIEG